MSLVGPRPLLLTYINQYTEEENQRHLVKPGITGLAQISGRNAISLKEKIQVDLIYVSSISFKADLLILIKTLRQVLKTREADGHLSPALHE